MILEAKNLVKKMDNTTIIDDISITIRENEILALVGPNGAGKTTLLKLLTKLTKPTKGNINLLNYSSDDEKEAFFNYISFMQDSSILYSEISGYDHLTFISKIRKIPLEEVEKVIKEMGIDNFVNKKVKKYSLGMKQHLLLAISLISKPKILLMDEPLNGLDPSGSTLLRKKVLELREQGTSVLFSSHILSEVDKIADRILFIRKGKIVEEKILTRDYKTSQSSYLLTLTDSKEEAIELLKSVSSVINLVSNGGNTILLTLKEPNISEILRVLLSNDIIIADIEKKEFQSELIYQNLFGEKNEITTN